MHAECTGLRATFIHRFLLDCAHFCEESRAGVAHVPGFAMARAAHAAQPGGCSTGQQQRYRTICEVAFTPSDIV